MSLRKILQKSAGSSQTATQLNAKLQNHLNMVYYPDLDKVKDIDELFKDESSFLLMYQKSPDFGHWVLISKSKQRPLTLEYFDPLGNPPETYVDEFAYDQGAQYPGSRRLTELMQNSRYRQLLSNGVDLQKDSPDIQTCGKWCLLRHSLLFVPMEKFNTFFESLPLNVRDLVLANFV